MAYLEGKLTGAIIGILAFGCLIFFISSDYLKLAGFAVSLIFIMLPGFLHDNWARFKRTFSKELISRSQMIIAIGCYLNFLGSANFYYTNHAQWYDTWVHFVNPMMLFVLTAALPILLQKLFFKKSRLWLTIFLNFILILLFSLFWEYYEYLMDQIFDSIMFGQLGETYLDTITDLIADFIGGLFASWLLYGYFYGYILSNISVGKPNK